MLVAFTGPKQKGEANGNNNFVCPTERRDNQILLQKAWLNLSS